jgi:hypothetical protein
MKLDFSFVEQKKRLGKQKMSRALRELQVYFRAYLWAALAIGAVKLFVFYLFSKVSVWGDSIDDTIVDTYTNDQFHYRRVSFSSHLKSKVGNILTKTAELRITQNVDGEPIDF